MAEADISSYLPKFHQLTQQGLQELLTMVAPIYVTETPRDAVILNGTNYLVYPQYEERVKAIINSGEPVNDEEGTTSAVDTEIIY